MFKFLKLGLCVFLVMTMLFTLISCSQSEDTPEVTTKEDIKETIKDSTTKQAPETTEQTTSTAPVEDPFKEHMEITWLTQYGDRHVDGRWDEAELEEKFNVDIEVWHYNSLTKDIMAALVAAGEIPDFFFMPGSPRLPDEMYEEGLTRSVPLSMIKKYLPGQYRLYEMMPIGLTYNLVSGKTDEFLGLTHIGMANCQYFYDATCVNLDWLENAGYEVDMDKIKPVKMITEGYENLNDKIYVGELDFSFEDLKDIMRAFTEDDPDENGEDDTFGMVYQPEAANNNMTQDGLFGFVSDINYLYKDPVSGDIVPKYAYTPYRDYLVWVSDMLSKGYMRKLPGEQSWKVEYKAIAQTNKVGIMQVHRTAYLHPTNVTYANEPPLSIVLNTDEDARFAIGTIFNGPDGKRTNYTYHIDAYGTGKNNVDMFGSQVDDDKMARILQMLEYTTFSSEENYWRFKSGVEGTHWKWAGEPYLSSMITTPEGELPEEFRGWPSTFSLWVTYSVADKETYDAVNNDYWTFPAYMYANNLYEKYALIPAKYLSEVYMGSEMFAEYTELNGELSAQINSVVRDFKNRALNGEIADINTEWTQYLDQLYAAGLEQLIEEFYNNPEYKEYDPGDKFKLRGRV